MTFRSRVIEPETTRLHQRGAHCHPDGGWNDQPLKTTAWQGGSRHAEWQELGRQVLQRDGYTGRRCNGTSGLAVYHLKARHQGGTDSPENLITLCEVCHYNSMRTGRSLPNRVTQTVNGEPVAFNDARQVLRRVMKKHAHREVEMRALFLHGVAAGRVTGLLTYSASDLAVESLRECPSRLRLVFSTLLHRQSRAAAEFPSVIPSLCTYRREQ